MNILSTSQLAGTVRQIIGDLDMEGTELFDVSEVDGYVRRAYGSASSPAVGIAVFRAGYPVPAFGVVLGDVEAGELSFVEYGDYRTGSWGETSHARLSGRSSADMLEVLVQNAMFWAVDH